MVGQLRNSTRYQALRRSGVVLNRMAPLVRLGLFGVGVSLFLDQVGSLVSDAQFTWGERRVIGVVALITLGGFGLAGWVAGRLMKASSELIDLFIDGADAAWRAADLIELQLVPTLRRIANALDRGAPATRDDDRARVPDALRKAIAAGRWVQAEQVVASLGRDDPDAAKAARDELAEARTSVVETLRTQLDHARDGNDPEAVVEARDALTEHLRGDALHDLDRQVVRWLLNLIQKRVRAGTAGADMALLAARVADSFGDTAEGASLRAALPNLRRSAGLCPQCARPFKSKGDACPQCLANGAGASRTSSRGKPLSQDDP
jgi:hypothetical protein